MEFHNDWRLAMTTNKNETAVDETADKNVLQNSVSTTSAADLNNPSTQPPEPLG